MIVIGFTGTRRGLSEHQRGELEKIFEWYKNKYIIGHVVHGGCVGADAEFHNVAKGFHRHVRPGYSVHNPQDLTFRGDFQGAEKVYPPKPYIKRNKEIVDESDVMIACSADNSGKGGTWSTINYTKRMGKPIIIIPNI